MRSRSRLVLALWLACSAVAAEPVVDQEFKALCSADAVLCADSQSLKDKLTVFVPPKPPFPTTDQIAGFNRDYNSLGDRADALSAKNKLKQETISAAFVPLRSLINTMSLAALPRDLADLSTTLAKQEEALQKLQIDAAASAPSDAMRQRLRAINESGTTIWQHLQTTSLNIDRLGHPTYSTTSKDGLRQVDLTDAGKLAGQANPLQARIAALSKGVLDLDKKLGAGLSWPETDPDARKAAQAGADKAKAMLQDPFAKTTPPATNGAAGTARAAAPSAPTLIDMRHVPVPPAEPAQRPPIYAGKGREDSEPAASNRVALLRAAQLTKTVGDPAGRAKYVFHQTGETCAIAAQITVLEEAGAVAADDKSRKAVEDALYDRAAKDNLFSGSAADPKRRFHGGTPNELRGSRLLGPRLT